MRLITFTSAKIYFVRNFSQISHHLQEHISFAGGSFMTREILGWSYCLSGKVNIRQGALQPQMGMGPIAVANCYQKFSHIAFSGGFLNVKSTHWALLMNRCIQLSNIHWRGTHLLKKAERCHVCWDGDRRGKHATWSLPCMALCSTKFRKADNF